MMLFALVLTNLSPAFEMGLKSLLIPGWGQFETGQSALAWGFLGTELVSGGIAAGLRWQGDNLRDQYAIWAYEKAGARPDWGEEYWREMERYRDYDAYIQGLWSTARRLYPDDPDAQAQFVDSVKLDQKWQWSSQADLQEFQHLRSGSRNALQISSTALGVMLANHMFSGLEAFIYTKFFMGTPLQNTRLMFRTGPGTTSIGVFQRF